VFTVVGDDRSVKSAGSIREFIGQHAEQEENVIPTQLEPCVAPTQQELWPTSGRYQHLLHAYDELYRESKQFLTSVCAGTSQHHSGALRDVLCNQRNVLADIQEQLRHVWVCFLFTVGCVPALMLHKVS
jgi:hypothetical protein